MDISQEFNRYVAHLSQRLGHADRHAGLSGYCTGLMLPLSRKSVEPMAARVDPLCQQRVEAVRRRLREAAAEGTMAVQKAPELRDSATMKFPISQRDQRPGQSARIGVFGQPR